SKVISKVAPLEIQAVGNVEAYSTITVRSQVPGVLTRVEFQEGADVKKGDLLFVVDPRPYQLQVTQAEANLAKDKAQLLATEANLARDIAQQEFAQTQAKRYDDLSQRGVIPRETRDQTNTQAVALQESVRADRAAIESSRSNVAVDQAALELAKLQ